MWDTERSHMCHGYVRGLVWGGLLPLWICGKVSEFVCIILLWSCDLTEVIFIHSPTPLFPPPPGETSLLCRLTWLVLSGGVWTFGDVPFSFSWNVFLTPFNKWLEKTTPDDTGLTRPPFVWRSLTRGEDDTRWHRTDTTWRRRHQMTQDWHVH